MSAPLAVPLRPRAALTTHEVTNQPPPMPERDLFASDAALARAVRAFGGGVHAERLSRFGAACGAHEAAEWAREANENPPRLRTFDRWGHRLDEVEFHPAYHRLMAMGLDAGVSSAAWEGAPAGHVLHGALMMLMGQVDAGVTCPMSMTHASVAALRVEPEVAAVWEPRVASGGYDPRSLPARDKRAVTIGMAMTEKQGGSDVRANATRAEPADGAWRLTGHKWFCSAPMSDAFLTLAQAPGGLTCFLVPRWTPDGERNAVQIARLKDKLGDRSNASAEIEHHGAHAVRLGEEGRGVRAIIAMVQLTRLDCALGSAAGMRAAVAHALWHAAHRRAFQRRLIEQPAMRAVLADLVVESEAATALALRVAGAMDAGEAALARLATPAAKYWVCKRQPGVAYEALEAHGGAGYVEEGPMPRLFRASPLNAIWEGSGNVVALDLLRAAAREPASVEAALAEVDGARGADARLEAHAERLRGWLAPGRLHEGTARAFARDLALGLQGAALAASAPGFVVEAFCRLRLAPDADGTAFGAVADGVDGAALLEWAMPA